jgi:predicted O-methyltransferase YrrM
MTTPVALDAASVAFATDLVAEDDALTTARVRAAELGCTPIGTGSGPLLRLLASAIHASHVVEVGTGTGVSSVWLLRGMATDGTLTSIDSEHDRQRAARETLQAAGIEPGRYRLIAGRAMEVLPRLADGAYDIVFIDADKSEYAAYYQQALRLLRPGGIVIIDNALWGGKVADPAQRDPETVGLRELAHQVAAEESLISALVPVGDGLLVGVLQDVPGEESGA